MAEGQSRMRTETASAARNQQPASPARARDAGRLGRGTGLTLAPIAAPLPPVPHRRRRPPVVTAIVAGAFAGGFAFAGSVVWTATRDAAHHTATAAPVDTKVDTRDGSAADPGDSGSTSSWTSTEELVVLTLIESKSLFDGYDPGCVLGVLQDHFPSLGDFTLATETDSPRLTSAAYDVIRECGTASAPGAAVGRAV